MSIVAWRGGIPDGIAMALAATGVWYAVDALSHGPGASAWVPLCPDCEARLYGALDD